MTDKYDEVMHFLKANSRSAFSAEEIARKLDLDTSTAARILSRLEQSDIVERRTKDKIEYFRYGDMNVLSERFVKASMIDYLERSGYTIDNETYERHGVDIKAKNVKCGTNFLIETKGDPKDYAQRENYFLSALGQILTRMKNPNDEYGIAFPYTDYYAKTPTRRIPNRVRKLLELNFFFVDKDKKVFKLQYDKSQIEEMS